MSASSPPTTSDPPGGEPARPAEPKTPPTDESEEQPSSDDAAQAPSSDDAPDGPSHSESREADKPPAARAPTKPPPVPTKRPGPPKEGATPTPPPSRVPPGAAARAASDVAPRRWPPVTVADIMTRKLIALGESDPVIDLEGGMKRFRFRHLPVVGAGNKLVGLISHRDLLRKPASKAGPSDPATEDADDEAVPAGTVASDLMRRDVLTARPDTPLASAARVMVQKKIGCLPVILDDNTLVGIVTETDFILLSVELLERR